MVAAITHAEPRAGALASPSAGSALVLNTSYEPLGVVSQRRAVVLIVTGKAVPVQDSDEVLHSQRMEMQAPAVVRLTRFVRVPYRASVPITRRGIFLRDKGRCVYCGAAATSLDHVNPRSRGGAHSWENVVAACRRCNHVKADRSLQELGWHLPRVPRQPTGVAWRILGSRRLQPAWRQWLGVDEEPEAASA